MIPPALYKPLKNYWGMGVRLSVGIALLVFLFSRHADIQQVWQLIARSDVWLLLFALFLAVGGEIITAYKWRRLVDHIGGNLPIPHAVRASFIGMFYNNFFPGSVGGDIVRVLLIAREAGGKARATASAFMQRNTGLAGLFIIGIPSAIFWPRHIEWPGGLKFPAAMYWLTDCRVWLFGALTGYVAVNMILFSQAFYGRIWKIIDIEETHPNRSRPHRILRKILQKIQRFHMELHGYRYWLPLPLIISAVTQIIDVYLVYNLGAALGISVSFPVLLVTVPMVSLANLAPVTINGIGLRETMYVALLHSAGVSASEAVALSLLQFAVITTLAAMGGVLQVIGKRNVTLPL